ncbi:MAG: YebC/PmpR family DNA-binding transcriptional regulator [Candidatus Magasanikbacteria bacterium]
MSGHSKWSKIQHKKGATDAKRGNIFTKLGKAITIASQQGGGDPEMNFSLRLAIDRAKGANMPKDNIEKAIKRGTGEGSEGVQLQELIYEGFGPGGVAVLVEAVTDNVNRTGSEVKHAFAQSGGSMGGPGCVQWQFDYLGVIRLDNSQKSKVKSQKSEFELELMDAGVEDIKDSDMGLELISKKENFSKVINVVKKFELEPESSGLEWIAKEEVDLDDETSAKVEKLYDNLDELDDVENVYTNES